MASGKHCSVPCCGEKVGPMYKFPKDAILRERWKSECKITRSVSIYMLVCHRHFRADDINLSCKNSRLKKGVLPTMNLPDLIRRKGRRNCIVHTCQQTESQDLTLHFFPKNAALQLQWASACKVLGKVSRNTRICSSHFSDDDFVYGARGLKSLKAGVIPCCNLPVSFPSLRVCHTSRQWTLSNSFYECDEDHGGTYNVDLIPCESEDAWIQRFIYE